MRYYFDAMNETVIVLDSGGREIAEAEEMPEAILEAVEGIARLIGDATSLEGWRFVVRHDGEAEVASIPFEEIGAFVAPGGGFEALRLAA